ncbi:MAG: acetyltransferase [Candidatus Yanofskybacteria bacterium RIFCSPHIGHO2_02_FULL_44_12b]|uniref:Acetyltransferase n=2 Tax=Candidatus Yanofskyibacteriota TaxID=1752733 RepID=A0A1F8GMX7_9BACT|nr:MAG: O-acetyltransferase [Candidatus Yanofskybacteria bacterium GW2011_GWA2_44_9]OGN04636.1 MAG: acetyltransferase [Candidatus Yanofskybacteria bacterium RIFCSPHIGHO2_01_FULL_44_24]OGN15698.1 MAG: acetyltransferase [Candidatus Yanofskybacteria bacterium RIFCSPHIGHO2_02_FULL_44_12b]OGN26754.1 MAG: acetyltransferase [Candidatus Yanofskybacteria bacterium RIFCSPLOWO2_01_FULL_44_22]
MKKTKRKTSKKSHQRFKSWKLPKIKDGQMTKWHWVVKGVHNFKLGQNTDIGAFTYIQAQAGVTIEDHVEIGGGCRVYSVSTIDNKTGHVHLKKNCRIGAGSTVLPGVTVGENSIVGAHSLVTKDIPANVIAFGCPAKVIRKI